MHITGNTDIGCERAENQDSIRYEALSDTLCVFVVCDGMGGAQAGNVASQIASDVFLGSLKSSVTADMTLRQIRKQLTLAANTANSRVYEKSCSSREFNGMGTTLVGGVANGDHVVLINIGDSRGYIDSDFGITKVTRDHSVVEELLLMGRITPDEARYHPHRNLITRALGTESDVKSDLYPLILLPGQSLMLCSDGLSGMLTDDEIHNVLQDQTLDADGKVKKLINLANENGGTDNITVFLLSQQTCEADAVSDAVPLTEASGKEPTRG